MSRVFKVYVIELDPEACATSRCFSRNGEPPIYVGYTRHTLDFRFRQHKEGGWTAARVVQKYGRRLVPDKCVMRIASQAEAEEVETERASHYREMGYCVFGGGSTRGTRRSARVAG